MKKLISFKAAANINTAVFSILVIAHTAIIIGILFFNYVPIDFLWGGRLKTKGALLQFEIISLVISALCLFFTLIKAKYLSIPSLVGGASRVMWIAFVFFLLNTAGNILAKTNFEKYFAVITLILAICSLRMALEKEE